ncbi:MAG: sugar phosphate isomerase/epimerase [Acidobacteriota bacterium]|nr:sugar phosphate isomerase/epimerase [Acidobacteriota bacterium]
MELQVSRRKLLGSLGALAIMSGVPALKRAHSQSPAPKVKSPFKLSVINDEVSQDFERSCQVISQDFGISYIELRGMWGKNILKLNAAETTEAQRLLKKYELKVTDIASPFFKVDLPGAPLSKKFAARRDQFLADFTYQQQDDVLAMCIDKAKVFGTDRVRIFDFWRLDDQAPYRAAIDKKLHTAAVKAKKNGITLMVENEFACNTATGAEAARLMAAVPGPLMMLWDAANAAMDGEQAFPDGYNLLPKNRIAHCHCKDVVKNPTGSAADWAPVGAGSIDWAGQFRALKATGYSGSISLETHWRGAGTPEASTRVSWAGEKAALLAGGALTA